MTSIIAIIIWALAPFSTDLKCSKYKTGTFLLNDPITQSDHLIERTDSIQTETDLKTGKKVKLAVTWIDDCEYKLRILEGPPDMMKAFKGRPLTIQITNTTRHGYTFKSFVDEDFIVTQTVTRVKTKLK